jgi:mono/diheme cytochrome c family protein
MVLKIVAFCAFLFLLFSCGESSDSEAVNTAEKSENPMAVAQELFEYNCTACHGSDGKLGASGAKDLTKSTLNDKDLVKLIGEGKNGMPPMEDLLGSQENVERVAEYVKSLRK